MSTESPLRAGQSAKPDSSLAPQAASRHDSAMSTATTTTAPSLTQFLADARVDLPGLDDKARAAFLRSISARQQALLYDATTGFRPLTLDDFVPAGMPPLVEVIH